MNNVVSLMSNPTLAERANTIRALREEAVKNVTEIGKQLAECRTILKEDGKWRAWLKHEFEWDEKTARNYINLSEWSNRDAERVPHCDLPLRSLYLLTAPTTSQQARDEVASRKKKGERVTHVDVATIVRKNRVAKPPSGPSALIVDKVKTTDGMTADEIAAAFPDLKRHTMVAAVSKLRRLGNLVAKVGERRPGSKSRTGAVLIASDNPVPLVKKKKTETKPAPSKKDKKVTDKDRIGAAQVLLVRALEGTTNYHRARVLIGIANAVNADFDLMYRLNEKELQKQGKIVSLRIMGPMRDEFVPKTDKE